MAEDREWSGKRRFAFWVRLLGVAIPVAFALATFGLSVGKWFWTRAGYDDVTAIEIKAMRAVSEIDAKKEDKEISKTERERIETRIDRLAPILSNTRDNLLLLMGNVGIKPKPMRAADADQ